MFIEFRCRCGHDFRTHIQNAGTQIPCPNCLAQVTVPLPSMQDDDSQSYAKPSSPSPKRSEKELPKESVRAKPVPMSESAKSRHKPKTKVDAKQSSKGAKAPDSMANLFDVKSIGPTELPEEELEELPTKRSKKVRDNSTAGDDEPPIKKSSKTGKKPKKNDGENVPLLIGGIIAGVAVLGALIFFAGPPLIAALKQGGKVSVPQEFEKFKDPDIFFTCEYPKDWEIESRGGSGNIPPSVQIEKGKVKIAYRASNSGAAIQDMSQAGANMMGELPDELKPVAKVHDFQKMKFSNEMQNYQEQGTVEKVNTGWGEGRVSTFTASGSFGSKIFAYRITLLTTNYSVERCLPMCVKTRIRSL